MFLLLRYLEPDKACSQSFQEEKSVRGGWTRKARRGHPEGAGTSNCCLLQKVRGLLLLCLLAGPRLCSMKYFNRKGCYCLRVCTHQSAARVSPSNSSCKQHPFLLPVTTRYNYDTKEMGDVITFVGTYGASRGQAAAVTFYTFIGRSGFACMHERGSVQRCPASSITKRQPDTSCLPYVHVINHPP